MTTMGSPPRARGRPGIGISDSRAQWAHPRVRGDVASDPLPVWQRRGSPPRARGEHATGVDPACCTFCRPQRRPPDISGGTQHPAPVVLSIPIRPSTKAPRYLGGEPLSYVNPEVRSSVSLNEGPPISRGERRRRTGLARRRSPLNEGPPISRGEPLLLLPVVNEYCAPQRRPPISRGERDSASRFHDCPFPLNEGPPISRGGTSRRPGSRCRRESGPQRRPPDISGGTQVVFRIRALPADPPSNQSPPDISGGTA